MDNIDNEHLCCALDNPKHQIGVDNKENEQLTLF